MRRLVAVAVAWVLLAGAPAAVAESEVVLGDGHVDYAARMVAGALQAQIKDGTGGGVVWREPSSVAFEVRAQARTTVPGDPRLGFLGAPGDPVWLIPQVQRAGLLWAGWNTEELTAADVIGPVSWSLEAVEGPGAVALFQTGTFGYPDVLFNSRDGLPDARAIALGTHAHGNWAFSATGDYRLTFTARATRPGGEPMVDTEVLEVRVQQPGGAAPAPGPDSAPVPGPPGGSGTEAERARLTLKARSARVRGRRLTVVVRLSERSRLQIKVRRRGRTVARARERSVGTTVRRLRVRLDRRLVSGRYTVRLRARAAGRTVLARVAMRVRASRRRASAAARAAVSREPVVLEDGHVDYGVRLLGGRLQSLVKDGTQGSRRVVWREPSDVVFHVADAARATVPDGQGLRFLGSAGAPIWMIPQVQKARVLWAGWNTEELDRDDIAGAVTWRLLRVHGPAPVALFLTGSFGQPDVIFDSSDGLPDRHTIPLGTHAHGNWAFRERGSYRLTFEMTARRASGGATSDTETVTFTVGDAGTGGADDVPPVGGLADETAAAGGGPAAGAYAASNTATGGSGSLPDTGAPLAPRALAGVALLLLGLAVRRQS